MKLPELKATYRLRRKEIEEMWHRRKELKSDDEMFSFLVSCILSSQAKWPTVVKAVGKLEKRGALWKGDPEEIRDCIKGISGRYANPDKLASYVVEAREQFPFLSCLIKGIYSGHIRITPHGFRFGALMRSGKPEPLSYPCLCDALCTAGADPFVLA